MAAAPSPRFATDATDHGMQRAPDEGPAGERHVHRFHVETGSEAVMLSIGGPGQDQREPQEPQAPSNTGHAPIPGGFAKFFNRVIDTGAWARLSDAARAVYLPLVRVADGQQGYRARAGVAALMRQTGLSRSSVKRGLKTLQEHRLITIVRAGGVAADGSNRTNLYQLLVPEMEDEPGAPPAARPQSAARAKRGGRAPASADPPPAAQATQPAAATWFSLDSFGGDVDWTDALTEGAGPVSAPPGVQERTPSPPRAEPPGASTTEHPPADHGTPQGAQFDPGTGSGGEPLLRASLSDSTSDATTADAVVQAKQMLEEIGVAGAVAEDLCRQHEPERIRLVATEAARRHRDRRIRSAAGFAVKALAEGWSIEPAGPDVATATFVERTAQEQAQRAAAARAAEEQRQSDDARLDALADDEWSSLVEQVLAQHADHPAMIRLLTRQASRQSRLMRAEVLALIKS